MLRPSGICGSGVIEAIAELFKAGLLDGSGRFVADAPTPRLGFEGAKGYVVLAWPHETSTGRAIALYADDVRAIQLAKAALYAGAKLLMRHYGLAQVDRIVLAGAFGAHISPRHAMILGMIPDCALDRVASAGNAAGTGARIALLNVGARREVETLVTRIHKVETAIEPRFQEHFVAANAIPHATAAFPHLPPLPAVSFNAGDGTRRRRRGG